MRTLTAQEKRTVRLATIGIAAYLVLFGGLRAWKWMDAKRTEYRLLTVEAQTLKQKVQPYEDKALVVAKLMEGFRMDPMKLSKTSLVAEASLAIQRSANTGGVQLGPIRETAARAAGKEMASFQLEAAGPVPSIMTFIQRFESLGYPLILDSVQINQDPGKPGMLKVNLTVVLLDFTQWKSEVPHA